MYNLKNVKEQDKTENDSSQIAIVKFRIGEKKWTACGKKMQ